MSNPLHAPFYADRAVQAKVTIQANDPIARNTFRLRFACPSMAARFLPGQFLMLRLSDFDDPLIGRPLALYDTVLDDAGAPVAVEVVYLVGGKMTRRLADLQVGQRIDVWGPLGNGFDSREAEQLIMVAGGIGYTPFPAVAREALGGRRYGAPSRSGAQAARVTMCYGARSADLLAGVDLFQEIGVDVRVATDDGTEGHHGLVTDLLQATLAESSTSRRIVCCGPERMMEAVADMAERANVACQVSLETPMACGVGICFSCVAKVRDDDGQWDYKRTCVEGPVFDAGSIVW